MNAVKMLFVMIIIISIIGLVFMNMADGKNVFPAWMLKTPYVYMYVIIIFIVIIFAFLKSR
jgi:hypothetical protein